MSCVLCVRAVKRDIVRENDDEQYEQLNLGTRGSFSRTQSRAVEWIPSRTRRASLGLTLRERRDKAPQGLHGSVVSLLLPLLQAKPGLFAGHKERYYLINSSCNSELFPLPQFVSVFQQRSEVIVMSCTSAQLMEALRTWQQCRSTSSEDITFFC